MNSRAKSLVADVLAAGGALRIAEKLAARRGAVIFMLHRVLPAAEMDDCYNPALAITPESFDAFVAWAKSHYRIVGLDELQATQGPACCLTFDDGWEDNHRFAFPILRKHDVPATIFLVSGLIGSAYTLPEERLFRIGKSAPGRLADALGLEPQAGYATVSQRVKRLPINEKTELLQELEAELDLALPPRRFMTWEEVGAMSEGGVHFGSHSERHAVLGVESDAVIRQELEASWRRIADCVPGAIRWLAYPNGIYDDRVVAAAKEVGYEGALTTVTGRVNPATDRFRLPRIAVDNSVANDADGVFSAARMRLHVVRSSLGAATRAY